MTSLPASRSSACWASSWLDSRSMSVLKRNPSLDSFATYTLPRNLTGYGGYSLSTRELMSIWCGVSLSFVSPRMILPPTVSWVALDMPMTMELFWRAVARILLTRATGLSGVPAVRDPSINKIPSCSDSDKTSWTQRSTWFRSRVRTRRVFSDNPPKARDSSSRYWLTSSEFGTWKSSGPHLLYRILSCCLRTPTARMAKIIPVSVSPILTLDASQATTGTNSFAGLMAQRLSPDENIEPPISSLSSESASSTPISTSETGRGLNLDPWSDCIDRVDNSTRDSGMEGSPMTSGMLFTC